MNIVPISMADILMGRHHQYPLSTPLIDNLSNLLIAVNRLERFYGVQLAVNSGYRPGRYNEQAGGATHSAHLTCQAVDLRDGDRKFTTYLLSNTEVLEECGLYMEHPDYTPSWVHVQTRPVSSGRRIFIPY